MQLKAFPHDDKLTSDMKDFADECYKSNMNKHSFSFAPLSIYMSGVDRLTGIAYPNWQARMKAHHPSKSEYPILYKEDLFINKRPND